MSNKFINKQSGLIKLIILIIVLVLILSYLGINIKNIAESEIGKANFAYLGEILSKIWSYLVALWDKYLASGADKLWDKLNIDGLVNKLDNSR